MDRLGMQYEVRDKIETNPDLLRLRGFSGERPERICTNLVPLDPPFPFFFCDYAPFLKERLRPSSFQVPDRLKRTNFVYGLSRYDASMRVIEALGLNLPPIKYMPAAEDGAHLFS